RARRSEESLGRGKKVFDGEKKVFDGQKRPFRRAFLTLPVWGRFPPGFVTYRFQWSRRSQERVEDLPEGVEDLLLAGEDSVWEVEDSLGSVGDRFGVLTPRLPSRLRERGDLTPSARGRGEVKNGARPQSSARQRGILGSRR